MGTFSYYIPFFYLPTYALQYGINAASGAILIAILNGASALGRILVGQISDYLGHMNSFLLCMTGSTLSILLIWPFCTSFATLSVFAVILGVFVGGYISTLPNVIIFLFGTENIGAIIGLVYSSMWLGTLGGPFIASVT